MPEGKSAPGVILTSKYVFSSRKFSEYINYINRSSATRSKAYGLYSVYADYMGDPKKRPPGFNPASEKASSLFTITKDQLTNKEKQELKHQFEVAQKNDSPMWQQVISFTDEFLEKYGLYDRASGRLDEGRIRYVTRLAMQEEMKDENMDGAAVWSAAIHYNTDNIHVHIAVVEPYPTRKRKELFVPGKPGVKKQIKGNMNPRTFSKMKSKIVNNIVNRAPELQKINDIIRNNIVAEKRSHSSYRDLRLYGTFIKLYNRMPRDRRLWKYNMNALHDMRPEIDSFTRLYMDMYHIEDFLELKKELQSQQEFLKSVYGSGKQKLYQNYAKTKMNDLYTRMGNAVLRELREYDKTLHNGKKSKEKNHSARNSSGLYDLKKALKKDYLQVRNQAAFRTLQQNIEYEQENENER
jgi:hypothetical protein